MLKRFPLLKSGEWTKTILLFLNFYLIITTYYIVKPVRGALVVSELGAKSLPYIWAATALTIALFIAFYSRLVDKFSRRVVVSVTTFLFIVSLLCIRYLLTLHVPWLTGVFYVWGDVFSVVMVEQFWSFTNDVFETKDAKRLYGLIGSGGILGGISGSLIASQTVTLVGTVNLVYVCAVILALQWGVTLWVDGMAKGEPHKAGEEQLNTEIIPSDWMGAFKLVMKERYVLFILISVVLTQVISNIIDYQFNAVVEASKETMDGKTAFYGNFFLWMNITSLVVMLAFTSPVQRVFGVMTAMMVLPVFNFIGFSIFLILPIPMVVFALKLMDKSLNYSINRATKELLYVPTTKEIKYKAKAVIDMFAYRFSKILSSALIIPFVAILSWKQLNVISLFLILGLMVIIVFLIQQYHILEGAQSARQEEEWSVREAGHSPDVPIHPA